MWKVSSISVLGLLTAPMTMAEDVSARDLCLLKAIEQSSGSETIQEIRQQCELEAVTQTKPVDPVDNP